MQECPSTKKTTLPLKQTAMNTTMPLRSGYHPYIFPITNQYTHTVLPCSRTACTSITSCTTLTTINQYTSSQSNNHPDINYSVLKNTTLHTTTFPNPHTAVLQTSNSIYTSPTKHPYKHLPHTNTPQHTNIWYTQPHTMPPSTPTTLQTPSLHLNPSNYPHLVIYSHTLSTTTNILTHSEYIQQIWHYHKLTSDINTIGRGGCGWKNVGMVASVKALRCFLQLVSLVFAEVFFCGRASLHEWFCTF